MRRQRRKRLEKRYESGELAVVPPGFYKKISPSNYRNMRRQPPARATLHAHNSFHPYAMPLIQPQPLYPYGMAQFAANPYFQPMQQYGPFNAQFQPPMPQPFAQPPMSQSCAQSGQQLPFLPVQQPHFYQEQSVPAPGNYAV
ncbi:hypothetical protein DdX_19405 [Ditylenchus destructor]|uniref:Uncharacterized protein n=1 Tax=Ditylenchus destructor TaxID=166010 RepID=A0AAD4MIH1_9BILA|nr:hypothetical protein DdX_19405 [Ditylenchus destructor]